MNNGYRLSPAGLLLKPEAINNEPDEYSEAVTDVQPTEDTAHPQPVQHEPVAAVMGDAAADETELWGHDNTPSPTALQAAVTRARQAVALQESEELRRAKSPADVRADVDQARKQRDAYRDYEDRVYQDRLSELDARRAHQQKLARHERKRSEDAASAGQRLSQLLDPTTALVRLQRARRWAPCVALLPALFAVVAGAVNVGTELSRINPGTWWINWAIEPLLTLPVVAILIAQIAGAVPSVAEAAASETGFGKRVTAVLGNQYIVAEIVLAGLAMALNVGLHFAGPDAHATGAWVWLVVPAGLVISMYLVPKLLADLTAKFVAAKSTLPQRPTAPAWEPMPVATPGVTPATYSENATTEDPSTALSRVDQITTELQGLIASGQWEHNLSTKPIRKRFGCGVDTARTVRDRVSGLSSERSLG